jgi:TonB family protein
MKLALPIAIGSLLLCTSLRAQEHVVTPGGATVVLPRARQCEKKKIEMVDLRASGPAAVELNDDYRKRVAEGVFFYFNPPEVKRPRYSIQQLVVHSNGTVSDAKVVESSQNDYFDREAKRAIAEAARAGSFLPLPEGANTESLQLELSFGRRAGETKSYLETRTSCPAWPKKGNPKPDYPREMREHSVQGIVRARFMVGIDGRVKPSSLEILQSSNPQFSREVEMILPKLEYQPAEVQGRKIEQLTEQLFTFGIEAEPGHD